MKTTVNKFQFVVLALFAVITFSACEKEERLEEAPIADMGMRLNQEPDSFDLDDNWTLSQSNVQRQMISFGSSAGDSAEFFTAAGMEQSKKPMVILAPGGAFLRYNEQNRLRVYANHLAQQGINVALMYYTIGSQNFNIYTQANQDLRSAVRYFKLNADLYGIDSANVFVGGWSSGAIVALGTAHFEEHEVNNIPSTLSRQGMINAINTHGFDNGDNLGASSKVRGVIAMFAFVFDTAMVDQGGPATMLINHHQSTSANGQKVVGSFAINVPNAGSIQYFGTDLISQRARNQGYVDGQNLEYLRLSGPSPYKGYNEASLDLKHLEAITNFIRRNTIWLHWFCDPCV